MKIFKRFVNLTLVCLFVFAMTGMTWAASTDTGNGTGAGTGNVTTNGSGAGGTNGNGTNDNASTLNGDIHEVLSFSNYGDNGNYEAIGDYEVAYGAALDEATSKLPDSLTAKLVTGEEVEIPVTWVCVDDGAGGTAYQPEHQNIDAVYVFEAVLPEGYVLADTVADDYVMPFATVHYTEDAQILNSTAEGNGNNGGNAVTDATGNDGGFSTWTWIIWIIVIIVVVILLWWVFAGNNNGKDNNSSV